MNVRNSTRWPVGALAACLVVSATARAEDLASAESLLSVGRLFGAGEFGTEPLPTRQWSRRSSTYFTLEKAAGIGRELICNDPATGKKEVVVPATAFVPVGAKEPLAVDAYAFSADESRVLIYTNSQRVWRRNTRGDYWLLDVATRKLRKLGGDASASSLMFATFSPDGTRVAFVRENNVYVQDVESLKITPLTTDGSKSLINGTSDWVNEEELDLRNCFRWSPDGRHILFWQFDTTGVAEFHLVDNVVSKSPRITSFAYPKVGEKNSATRLGVVPAGGGKVQWLDLPGDAREYYLPHADWTPDGAQILVQQFNRLQTELKVFRADPATGQAKAVFTEKDAAWLENENPWHWLDGGKALLWLSERSGWRHAYRAPTDGSPPQPITKGEFDVIVVEAVDESDGWLYYAASPKNATQRYLFRSKLDGSKTEQLTPEKQTGWHEYDFSPDAKWAVHTWSNFTTPPVVELVRPGEHAVVRTLADNAKLRGKLAAVKRPEIEFMRVPIGDGVTLDGWSMKPAKVEPSAKVPLLMYVYGEPHGQTVRDAWPGPRGLWHWMLAQQGFVVASVDNRGTNVPRGREWRKSVHRKIGIVAPTEQAAAVRVLLQRWPFVDPARVGSWGWSGGGSMTLNALFRHPDLYRTGVAIAPVADQTLYDSIYQERYMGLPADNAAGYRDGSPITRAGKLRGNLLLVHGTGDDNCHYQGTERLMEELIAKGKRFSVLPYPNRSHAIREGRNTDQHLMETMTRFLRDNLQSPHAPPPDPVYETRTLRGWTVHINRELLAADARSTAKALELLDRQLDEITKVVPKAAVAKLQKVPLYFNPEYPGVRPVAEYHPGADWLRKNGRDPAMAGAVEFTDVHTFEAEVNRMPWFVLHELAHGYHDRELPKGFGNPDIAAAYTRAKDSGKYDKVERHFGNGRPNTVEKAYAMTTPMEYFAETTEAYFGRNDFFPFTRDELKKHDPDMFELLGKLWGVAADPAPLAAPPSLAQQLLEEPAKAARAHGDAGTPFGSDLSRADKGTTAEHLVEALLLPPRVAIVAGAHVAPLRAAEPRKPNIVYLLTDDLGYGDVGCYNPASKIPTPNMDRLAKEGVRFTDAHSPSAVCTPTRYALLTGRYAWRTRLQRNVIGPFSQPLIAEKQLTVGGLLREQGYATACIGKWHLGWGWPAPGEGGKRDFTKPIPDGPTTRGFDSYFGTDVPNYPPYCFLENDRTVGIPSEAATVGRDSFNIAGPMVPGWKLVDVLPGLEKRAAEYIETAAKGDKPFFLYLPLTSPHYPVVPAAAFKGKSKVGDYGDFVVQTDHVLGAVLDALKRSGVAERTLVILTSDNGPEVSGEVNPGVYDRLKESGHASMGTLRGAKRDAWEGGHRVPFIARWPGKTPAGSTCDETVCHVDLMATLAALLDVKLPADAGMDSVNILPALFGEKRKAPLREATVYHSGQGKFAIRSGDWVLILAPTGDDNGKKGEPPWFQKDRGYAAHTEAGELFNLATDPAQKTNRYSTETAKVNELKTLMERYVTEGRSTPGPKQKNDVEITWDKRGK